jgi:replication initiation protein RepC
MNADRSGATCGYGYAPGLRKLTPKMLGTIEVAQTHRFTSDVQPGHVLASFKAAAPFLGLRPNVVHAIDWLFRFTDAVDWQPSSRPIVWPSAALQQQELGLGPSQVKNLNRYLVELGLVVMKDSPNGKRYGRRDLKGRIIEAYGFDLSPLASRCAEFQAVAEAGREERALLQALRRRATVARNGIRQLLETALEHEVSGDEWEAHRAATVAASRGVAGSGRSTEMETAVARLERLQSDMRGYLEVALHVENAAQPQSPVSVNPNPTASQKWPHITTTNQLPNPRNTVIASNEGSRAVGLVAHGTPDRQEGATRLERRGVERPQDRHSASRTDSGSVLKITPAELVKLAPRLKAYLGDHPTRWPEIVDAADWLRGELGISQYIWGDACLTMGREQAAIAVAIVSTKPPGYFRGSAGGYFHGMVARAKSGQLHLTRTIWGMRGHGEHRNK